MSGGSPKPNPLKPYTLLDMVPPSVEQLSPKERIEVMEHIYCTYEDVRHRLIRGNLEGSSPASKSSPRRFPPPPPPSLAAQKNNNPYGSARFAPAANAWSRPSPRQHLLQHASSSSSSTLEKWLQPHHRHVSSNSIPRNKASPLGRHKIAPMEEEKKEEPQHHHHHHHHDHDHHEHHHDHQQQGASKKLSSPRREGSKSQLKQQQEQQAAEDEEQKKRCRAAADEAEEAQRKKREEEEEADRRRRAEEQEAAARRQAEEEEQEEIRRKKAEEEEEEARRRAEEEEELEEARRRQEAEQAAAAAAEEEEAARRKAAEEEALRKKQQQEEEEEEEQRRIAAEKEAAAEAEAARIAQEKQLAREKEVQRREGIREKLSQIPPCKPHHLTMPSEKTVYEELFEAACDFRDPETDGAMTEDEFQKAVAMIWPLPSDGGERVFLAVSTRAFKYSIKDSSDCLPNAAELTGALQFIVYANNLLPLFEDVDENGEGNVAFEEFEVIASSFEVTKPKKTWKALKSYIKEKLDIELPVEQDEVPFDLVMFFLSREYAFYDVETAIDQEEVVDEEDD